MDEYARFAFLYDFLVGGALRPLHASMLSLLSTHHCRTVVDLCCGTGQFCGMATTRGLESTGVDFSPAMLKVARRTHPGRIFIQSDATRTPLPDNSFDAATISFALHEKPRPMALGILAEAARLTRPDGVIVVADYRMPGPNTAILSGLGIRLVERLAGKTHHACFAEYMEAGGTDAILKEADFSPKLISTHMNGWAATYSVLAP